jgi:hypothetical protein
MEETKEEFFKAAKKEFGDKINVIALNVPQEQIDQLNQEYSCHLTKDDFNNYGEQAWLMENKCPACSSDLLGLFGSFKWGIAHGVGECSNCGKVILRYYHYVGDCKQPICAFTLNGF